jgi:hypothetical protein
MSVKSKQRVKDHGEVFTPEHIVYDMLDLVKNETERIESRFLESACGDGNFLVPILERKLEEVEKKYKSSQIEFERMAFLAVSSIYGVELLQDNVKICIERLYNIIDSSYMRLYKDKCNNDFRKSIYFVLEHNILQGDALTLKTTDGKEYIIFSEWSLVNNGRVKRRDFTFEELIKKESTGDGHLLDLLNKDKDPFLIPQPIKEYPLMHYLKLKDEDAE